MLAANQSVLSLIYHWRLESQDRFAGQLLTARLAVPVNRGSVTELLRRLVKFYFGFTQVIFLVFTKNF